LFLFIVSLRDLEIQPRITNVMFFMYKFTLDSWEYLEHALFLNDMLEYAAISQEFRKVV